MRSKIFNEQIALTGLTEGKYSNDPDDRGGETNHGVTIAVARAYGYKGPMRDLPKETADDIFYQRYYVEPGFDKFEPIFPELAKWLLDTGINMGQTVAARMLQINLNVLNDGGKLYADIKEDGAAGTLTRAALNAYIQRRGVEGKRLLLRACEGLQWGRYVDIVKGNPSQERFTHGWVTRAFD